MIVETLANELNRAVEQLVKLDINSAEYDAVLGRAQALSFLNREALDLQWRKGENCGGYCADVVPAPFVATVMQAEETKQAVVIEPVEEEEEDADDELPRFDLPTTRKMLGEARANGVNIANLLKELGYENLSAVPDAQYGQLLQMAGCI